MNKVDIHYDSLLNWFIGHDKISSDCRVRFIRLESEAKELIESNRECDLSVSEYINRHFDADNVAYHHLKKITEILENNPQTNQKNIIGQYTFEPLYKSKTLLKKYDYYKLYLVAYTEILRRNIKYRIPFLSSSIKNLEKQLNNLVKKQSSLVDNTNLQYKKLKESFVQYGLDINNFTNRSCIENLLETIKLNCVDIANEYLISTFSNLFKIIKNELQNLVKLYSFVLKERNFDAKLMDFQHLFYVCNDLNEDAQLDEIIQIRRNPLLGEIKELQIFIIQIKNEYKKNVINPKIMKIFENTNFDDFINIIEKTIELINGPKTIEMIQIKYNPEYSKQCALKEIDSLNKYFSVKDLSEKTEIRAKQTGEQIQNLSTKLKELKDETAESGKIIESLATELTGININIIGIK